MDCLTLCRELQIIHKWCLVLLNCLSNLKQALNACLCPFRVFCTFCIQLTCLPSKIHPIINQPPKNKNDSTQPKTAIQKHNGKINVLNLYFLGNKKLTIRQLMNTLGSTGAGFGQTLLSNVVPVRGQWAATEEGAVRGTGNKVVTPVAVGEVAIRRTVLDRVNVVATSGLSSGSGVWHD